MILKMRHKGIKLCRFLGLMKAMSLSNLYSRTGCLPKCAQTKYKFNPKKSTPINWRSSSISSFYLTAESDQVEEQVEYLVYDMQVRAGVRHAGACMAHLQEHKIISKIESKESRQLVFNKNRVYIYGLLAFLCI